MLQKKDWIKKKNSMILSMRGQEYDYEFQETEVPVISQLKQEDIDQFQRDNNDSSSSSEES